MLAELIFVRTNHGAVFHFADGRLAGLVLGLLVLLILRLISPILRESSLLGGRFSTALLKLFSIYLLLQILPVVTEIARLVQMGRYIFLIFLILISSSSSGLMHHHTLGVPTLPVGVLDVIILSLIHTHLFRIVVQRGRGHEILGGFLGLLLVVLFDVVATGRVQPLLGGFRLAETLAGPCSLWILPLVQ